MAILTIIKAPDPMLKTKADPVSVVDDQLRQQIDDMFETMYDDGGIGLAATQVGITNRVLVLDIAPAIDEELDDDNDGDSDDSPLTSKDEPEVEGNPMVFINPEITFKSEELNTYNEGCLSVPGMYAEVTRPKIIHVTYLDYNGNEQMVEADGLLATCLQHEIDHLDGILFVDHLSPLKRNMILKKMAKAKKLGQI